MGSVAARAPLAPLVAIVAALALFVVVAGVVVTSLPVFAATDIVVNGSTHISQETAESLVEVPSDATLFNIDSDAIEQSLKKNPWVEGVTIERQFPHTLVITPVEYEAAAIVYISSSDIAWAIDADGTWIAPVSLAVTLDSEGNVVSSSGTESGTAATGGTDADASGEDSSAAADAGEGTDGAQTVGDGASDATDDSADGSNGTGDDMVDDTGDDTDVAGDDDTADDADTSDDADATSDDADSDGDSAQALSGIAAAVAVARQNGAVVFTDIPSDVEPASGDTTTSDAVLAGLAYVSGFSDEFLEQIESFSLESVEAISINLDSGVEVALGDSDDIALKERVVEALLDQETGVTYIDARDPSNPTFRNAPTT